ncbi:hypothetical protein EMIT0P253_70097 [Pseudomonas sp. IT-P253]
MVSGLPLSRAGSLPHLISGVHKTMREPAREEALTVNKKHKPQCLNRSTDCEGIPASVDNVPDTRVLTLSHRSDY